MLEAILNFFYWLLALIGLGQATQQQQIVAPEQHQDEEEHHHQQRRNIPAARGQIRRRKNAAASASSSTNDDHESASSGSDESDDDGSDHDSEAGEEDIHIHSKLTRNERVNLKKMEKRRQKQALKEQREAMVQAEKERKTQMKKKMEDEELEREEKEAELREAERIQREEKEKKKQEEYEEWRHLFEVSEQGEGIDSDMTHNESILSEFINYIKDHKVVVLEDLASEFKIKTEHCINRIKSLEEEGKITGLLDDRGKFIYISKEEIEKVKQFILQEGRISISDLRNESNKLINLKPKEEDVNIEEILVK
ncbi:predicted protein [Naegleria gruberi]|uniref:DDRGK domain-containing protein 1 n=1 Tax=Naegleria gruberi TaxID=5762 RepID=D2VYK8_NAEGR|nr:uncharacterized protein NAEGRDRAFT_53285 [Naegleria gruberi]EFC38074.1 predicted protein [Naegleria gruberi]|eukprot:XP_002670818.1 predicted protein [Naegleria gruberi strain NEG-M]